MRRKSNQVKKLSGTSRRDRAKTHEGTPAASLRCPDGLPDDAQKVWRRIAPLLAERGLLTALDVETLRDLCLCAARLREAEALVKKNGLLVDGYRGSKVKNPAATMAREYRQDLYRWAAKFGLTPGDRSAFDMPEPDNEPSLAEQLWRMAGEESKAAGPAGDGGGLGADDPSQ